MPESCCWGDCPEEPTRREDGTWACVGHRLVHVAGNGSHVDDRHADGGHG